MDFTDILAADPDRTIMLAHLPSAARNAVAALWRLDLKGAEILRTTSEPLIGQMRLTWWHDALAGLDRGPAPAEPLLIAAAERLLPAGIVGNRLAAVMVGWEPLLNPLPWTAEALAEHAVVRGGGLFAILADLLGAADERVAQAGQGWALVDIARHVGDEATRIEALAQAKGMLAPALAGRWPRPLRPLGLLARFAEQDRAAGAPPARGGSPARMLTALRFRLVGR